MFSIHCWERKSDYLFVFEAHGSANIYPFVSRGYLLALKFYALLPAWRLTVLSSQSAADAGRAHSCRTAKREAISRTGTEAWKESRQKCLLSAILWLRVGIPTNGVGARCGRLRDHKVDEIKPMGLGIDLPGGVVILYMIIMGNSENEKRRMIQKESSKSRFNQLVRFQPLKLTQCIEFP